MATLAGIRRLLAIAPILLVGLCGGCGSSTDPGTTRAQRPSADRAPAKAPARPVRLSYRPLFALPAAVQDPATAFLGGGRFVLLGGVTPEVTSTDAITVADAHGTVKTATLPGAQHDAQAAVLGGQVYVFGGAEYTQYDHILRFDPGSSTVTAAGALPSAQSDVAVTSLNGTAYVVGGFDGSNALNTIVAWTPGGQAHVVGHLPVALRYAAVAAVPGAVLIAGGSTPTGASSAIYRFTPATGAVQQIGRLAQPLTHAGAAVLGSTLYVVGGRGDSTTSQSPAIWAIDPATGLVKPAGHLPQPLSDAGVVSLGDAIIVAGGRAASGTQGGAGELVPAG